MYPCFTRIGVLILSLGLLALPQVLQAAPAKAPAPKTPPPAAREASGDVLVQIGNKIITKSEFDARLAALPPEYSNRLKTDEQKREFLEGYVQAQLLAMEAKAQKMDKSKSVLMRIEDMSTSILAQEYARTILARVPKVSDGDVQKFFDANKAQFVQPAMVNAQHILVKLDRNAKPEEDKAALAKIDGIRKEIVAGADFGKTAEKYSDDPGSKSKGGSLGFFAKDRMVPEFSQAAFGLKKGELSQPVKSPFGYHLIKVTDTQAERPVEFKEAAPRIRAQLENKARQDAIRDEVERLKKKYPVTMKP
jgi:peptidyl-prolyl cis-trans isomerase C